jgi:CAAX prenyl protease-like protein
VFVQKIFFGSPAVVRIAPFFIFVLVTVAQEKIGGVSGGWLYLAKTIIGVGMIFAVRPFVAEMHWAVSWEAIVTGILIFAIWVGLDSLYPHLQKSKAGWDPLAQLGSHAPLAWLFIATHLLGSTFVVPPIEEIFYRSFLYRYVASKDFLSVSLDKFLPVPFLVTALVFGLAHNEWLAGILCGAAYQWLVLRKNRLGDAMTAHAITNCLLGVWVVWRGAWHFW